MKNLILGILLFVSVPGWSSTFVGNGGNVGDVELQVALSQLQDTLSKIIKDKNDPQLKLCTCYEKFEGRSICNTLRQLNTPQVNYCAAFIQKKAPEILALIERRESIHFNWTHETIEVREDSQIRGADAATDFTTNKVTINQKRFLALNAGERVFLLGHELFHLVKDDGRALRDDESKGPFLGPDGGRQFINAMAASFLMEAYDYGTLVKYDSTLARSQAVKHFWIHAGASSLTMKGDDSSAFTINESSGTQIGIRYQWDDWGALVDYAELKGKKDILTSIKGEERRRLLGVGVAYRWFPSENPLTFWGQSHLLLTGKYELLSASYEFKDTTTGADDTTVGSFYKPWVYC